MVDMELVQEKLIRGGAVGVGAFASGYIGSQITDISQDIGDNMLAASKIGLGVGASIVADDDDLLMDLDSSNDSMQSEAVEFVGYGLQGAGWKELGESLDVGFGGDGGGRGSSATSKRVRRKSRKRKATRVTQTDGGGTDNQNVNQRINEEDGLMIDA